MRFLFSDMFIHVSQVLLAKVREVYGLSDWVKFSCSDSSASGTKACFHKVISPVISSMKHKFLRSESDFYEQGSGLGILVSTLDEGTL